jgi:hypothetical protein
MKYTKKRMTLGHVMVHIKLSGMTKGLEDAHNLEDVHNLEDEHNLEDAHCTDNLARSGEMQQEKLPPSLH